MAAVDDLPVAVADSINATEDTVFNGNLSTNDTPSGDGGNVWSLATGAANGTVVVNPDGTFTYTPNANYNGADSFTYTITDADGDTSTATVSINVAAVDDLPVAVADSINATEDTVFNGNLSTNDTPSGDGGNVWSLATGAANGTVVVNPDGTFTYTPNANYNGADSFTYTITDADGDTSTATVSINVAAVDDLPVAVADSINATEDTVFNGNLSTNDTPSGDGGNVWSLATGAANGTVVVNPDGTFTYTPNANYNGADSFTYTITDADGDTSTATVSINVAAVDDLPVAVADSINATEDTVFNGNLSTNDTPSGDGGNVWSLATGAANGTVVVNPDGTFTYTPNANYNGADSFTYTITDADGDTSTATVSINVAAVDDLPVAVADSINATEDTVFNGNLSTNDTPSGDGGNVWSLATGAANGTVVVNPDGTFTYTPNANYNGADSFTYTITDADGDTSTATVSINVAAVDDLPVAVADSINATEDTVFNGNLSTNDTPSGDGGNVWSLATGAANGTVVVNPDGTFTYTPNANYNGADSFTYTITDADGDTSTATVSINVAAVDDLPVAVADSINATEDTVFNGNLSTNDTPSGDGGNVWSLATGAANGTVVVNPDGTFTYTPNANYNGADSFTYTITDADGDTSTATVSINVAAVDDLPVAVADSINATEDTVFNGNLSTNDTPSGDGGNVWSLATGAANGTVVVNPDGTFTYTPNANYNGADSFTYTITDADGDTSTATVSINVAAVDDLPVAVADSINATEDTVFNGNLSTNDTPSGDGGNVWSLATGAANGTVVVNPDGTFTYTPNANYNGADSFTYTITDADGDTSTATVSINVAAVNDAPVDSDETNVVTEDVTLLVANGAAGDLLNNATDADGNPLTISAFTVAGQPGPFVVGTGYAIAGIGTITINANGSYSFAPATDYTGVIPVITYTVNDGVGGTDTSTLTLSITPVNDAPVGNTDNYTAIEGTTTLQSTVLVNDADVEGSALNVSQFATNTSGLNALAANGINTITTVLGGTIVMNANGTYTYTAPVRNHADVTPDIDSFAYKANDGGLDSAWTTVTINITDTNPIANNDVDSVGIGSTVAGNVITGTGGVTADTLNVDSPFNLTNVVLTTGTQISNTLNGTTNVRTIVTNNGTLAIDLDDGSYTYTAGVTARVVTNPTGTASFTAQGINLYGFDTAEPYNTAGNVNSGLNLANLNATSAARARFQENAGEADDGVGAEQNAGDTNTNRTENGEQLVISLGVASKSTSIALSNLFTGEVATWETYNAAGTIVSSGTTAGDADGLTNINISSGTAFSYVVVRSTAAGSHYRVDGITVIPEPSGVSDVFTYTLTDSDGDTSSATLTMNYDTTTTTNNDTATVYESGINAIGAQAGGTQEAQTIERATGNLLANDTGVSGFSNLTISGGTITGGTVTASAPDGNGVVTVTVTDTTSGSRAIATITVYTQDFGANVKGDYVVDLVGRTTDGAGTNDSFTMNYTLTNSVSGEVDNSTLTVDVVDDVPTVQNAIVQVQTATLPDTNLVFVIDSSGSMDGEVKSVAADGTVTIMNRLQATQLAVAAVINEYFSQGGNISVTLIDFDATAADRGTYNTAADAINALNNPLNFAVGGGTNYEAALTQVMTSMGVVNTSENNTVYFISDGVPTVGDTTDPAANGYRNFITTNGIKSYAIGIASDISNPTELNNIHNVDSDGSGVKDAAIIVTNVATLDDVLLASVPTSFGGSVAGSTASSSLNFGADGGYISSLVMRLDTNGDNVPDADVTFNYNPTTGQITVVGGGTPQTGFPLTSNMLTLNNANGFEDGILIFNFTTGEYTYQTAGFATEGEQFDINFVATDGDGDTASGKQTIQIVDGKPEANNDVDTLMGNASFFEGNVISAIGTDGGDSLQLTSFSTGRSGEDNPGDNGAVSSIVFKGVTFNLTAVVGSTAALGGTYTVTTIGGVNTLSWTHATNGSSLVFNEDGYYRYAPPTAELSTNVTGASTNYTLTSAALVTTAATAGMALTGIARTSAAEGSAAINTPNADGVGIVGNTNTRIDSLESLVITFDTSLHPHGVQGVTITVDTSNSNLGGTNAFNYNVYNVHGDLIGQFASNLEGNVVLPASLTGIGKIVIDAGGVGSYPGAYGSISAVRYSTILDTAGTPAPAAEVISYTITDTDGDTSNAILTLNNIIDDIAGTSANNTINGTGRNENISGFAGDDTINAGAGYDIVRGGDGNDTIDGGANDDQLYGNAGNDIITGGTGKDQIYGDDGNDILSGNDGDDYISGGAGNDIINGGLGADVILGGAGNDTLTGGSMGVVDTFRWELADRGTTSAPATDVITDFDPAAAGSGGDVLDLRDLLSGESHTGVDSGNLASYLHFEVVGANTVIHISDNGGFSNGFSPAKDVQKITLTGVDLVTGFADDQAIIQNLLTNNKLITD